MQCHQKRSPRLRQRLRAGRAAQTPGGGFGGRKKCFFGSLFNLLLLFLFRGGLGQIRLRAWQCGILAAIGNLFFSILARRLLEYCVFMFFLGGLKNLINDSFFCKLTFIHLNQESLLR